MICFPLTNIPKIEKIGIYAVHNKINDKYYIGSAFNVYSRLLQHERDLRLRDRLTVTGKISEDYKKYGKDNFEFIILETFENGLLYEELYKKEREYAVKYNAIHPYGYNTWMPAPTNSGKCGQPIRCHSTDELIAKRKEYNKNFTTLTCRIKESDMIKFKNRVKAENKSVNQALREFIIAEIEKNKE